jgi:hypothetical protein
LIIVVTNTREKTPIPAVIKITPVRISYFWLKLFSLLPNLLFASMKKRPGQMKFIDVLVIAAKISNTAPRF